MTRKEEGVWTPGGLDKKRGRSQEVVTRQEERGLRLGQEKKKESGGCDKKRGMCPEVVTRKRKDYVGWAEKRKDSGGWDKKRGRSLEAGTRKEEGVKRLG